MEKKTKNYYKNLVKQMNHHRWIVWDFSEDYFWTCTQPKPQVIKSGWFIWRLSDHKKENKMVQP